MIYKGAVVLETREGLDLLGRPGVPEVVDLSFFKFILCR